MTKGGVKEVVWLRLWVQAKIKFYNNFIEENLFYLKFFIIVRMIIFNKLKMNLINLDKT